MGFFTVSAITSNTTMDSFFRRTNFYKFDNFKIFNIMNRANQSLCHNQYIAVYWLRQVNCDQFTGHNVERLSQRICLAFPAEVGTRQA